MNAFAIKPRPNYNDHFARVKVRDPPVIELFDTLEVIVGSFGERRGKAFVDL